MIAPNCSSSQHNSASRSTRFRKAVGSWVITPVGLTQDLDTVLVGPEIEDEEAGKIETENHSTCHSANMTSS